MCISCIGRLVVFVCVVKCLVMWWVLLVWLLYSMVSWVVLVVEGCGDGCVVCCVV